MGAQSSPEFVLIPNPMIGASSLRGGVRRVPTESPSGIATAMYRTSRSPVSGGTVRLHVMDKVEPGGSSLVTLDGGGRDELAMVFPEYSVVPVTRAEPLWVRPGIRSAVVTSARPRGLGAVVLEVKVVDALSGQPLRDIAVVGYSDRRKLEGASGLSNAQGLAKLSFPPSVHTLESVEAYPAVGYWPAYQSDAPIKNGPVRLACAPVDLSQPDIRRHFGFEGTDNDGAGVRVGVIDSGVAKHPDLKATRLRRMVKDSLSWGYGDALGHGTHVCGIIAGRGRPGHGVRGGAPAVELYSYRVFEDKNDDASSFIIAKAIRQAVADGCHLINLSLGSVSEMADVAREVSRARSLGVVCLAATGNDDRGPVRYPAKQSEALAVSAFGRKNLAPAGSAQELAVTKPYGSDRNNFMASFSNVGNEVDLTGPGVGVVSTYPDGYAIMDGTSMACPAVTGALARRLARSPRVLQMNGTQRRADRIVEMAVAAAKDLGFGARFEGSGVLV